jgi:hypothetical protein
MKTRFALFLLTVASAVVLVWQRQTITALRRGEALDSGRAARAQTVGALALPQGAKLGHREDGPGLPERQFSEFLGRVNDYRKLQGAKRSDDAWAMWPSLYEPLSRLSAAQVSELIDGWSDGQPITDTFLKANDSFLWFVFQAASVNPRATLEALLQHPWPATDEQRISHFALHIWFQDDPAGLERWLQANSNSEIFGGKALLWADAAKVVGDPSEENVRQFLTHEGDKQRWSRGDLLLKLGTPEARIAFLKSLHAATGGISDELPAMLGPLMQRTSFAQLARLGDAIPTIRASGNLKANSDWGNEFPKPLSSLRFEIARSCRDGTAAQRWAWLVKREEDRPTGVVLEKLIECWCENDCADTAAWAHGLPESPARTMAIKGVGKFLADHK